MLLKNWLRRIYRRVRPVREGRSLGVELVNVCNLHCSYCFRDEEMLYGKAQYLDETRLFSLVDGAPEAWKPIGVTLTGGEPALHPRFGEVVQGLTSRNVRFKVVTNGWHFDRIHEHLAATRRRLVGVAFSLDGATRAAHDLHRGTGSFDRIMKALALCRMSRLPVHFNVVLRRDTLGEMERIAVLAARLGGEAVSFGALLPTSVALHRQWGLSQVEEMEARREASALSRLLNLKIRVAFGLYDRAPGAHCPPMLGRTVTLDYKGQLRLCGNLSSFRGGANEGDVPEAAATATLEEGWSRIDLIGHRALHDRDSRLAQIPPSTGSPDPILGSPCLSCLRHFDKLSPEIQAHLLST